MLAWRGAAGGKRAREEEDGRAEMGKAPRRPVGWLPAPRVRDPRGLLGGQLSGGVGAGRSEQTAAQPASAREAAAARAAKAGLDLADGLDLVQLRGMLVQVRSQDGSPVDLGKRLPHQPPLLKEGATDAPEAGSAGT